MAHSPGVVSPVGLDEIHVAVFGQEGYQLIIGPVDSRGVEISPLGAATREGAGKRAG